jgi:hypothetical protein
MAQAPGDTLTPDPTVARGDTDGVTPPWTTRRLTASSCCAMTALIEVPQTVADITA